MRDVQTLLMSVLLIGCGGTSTSGQSAQVAPQPEPEASTSAQDLPARNAEAETTPATPEHGIPPSSEVDAPSDNVALAPPVDPLIHEAEGDLDGDGTPETLRYYLSGRVTAGEQVGQGREDLGGFDVFEVVQFDRNTRVLVAAATTNDEEDPPTLYQLFALENHGLVRILDVVTSTYNHNELHLPGNGRAWFVEDSWGACMRDEYPPVAQVQRVTYRRHASGEMYVARRSNTGDSFRCENLAACPYVDVLDADGTYVERGEILRFLNSPDAHGEQTLDLGDVEAGRLVVRLREDKDEVTHLFETHLEVDGVPLAAMACATESPAWCGGEQALRMGFGDRLELVFDVPRAGHAVLSATGYYVPTREARLSAVAESSR